MQKAQALVQWTRKHGYIDFVAKLFEMVCGFCADSRLKPCNFNLFSFFFVFWVVGGCVGGNASVFFSFCAYESFLIIMIVHMF